MRLVRRLAAPMFGAHQDQMHLTALASLNGATSSAAFPSHAHHHHSSMAEELALALLAISSSSAGEVEFLMSEFAMAQAEWFMHQTLRNQSRKSHSDPIGLNIEKAIRDITKIVVVKQ